MLPKAEYLATLPRKRMIASALIRDSVDGSSRFVVKERVKSLEVV